MEFRIVQEYIETRGGISILLTHNISLRIRSPKSLAEWSEMHSRRFWTSDRCTNQNATGTEFLEVQIPLCVSCMTGTHRCSVSSSRSVQKLGGKKNINMK